MLKKMICMCACLWIPFAFAQEDVSVMEEAEATSTESPFKPYFGDTVYSMNGEEASLDRLEGKYVGIYFSASWCPPCRQFTPMLVKFRNAFKENFDVVFVSSDRSENAQYSYMKKYKMDWLTMPFRSQESNRLAERFRVRGIPKLVILDQEGNVVSEDGRGLVSYNMNLVERPGVSTIHFERKEGTDPQTGEPVNFVDVQAK